MDFGQIMQSLGALLGQDEKPGQQAAAGGAAAGGAAAGGKGTNGLDALVAQVNESGLEEDVDEVAR